MIRKIVNDSHDAILPISIENTPDSGGIVGLCGRSWFIMSIIHDLSRADRIHIWAWIDMLSGHPYAGRFTDHAKESRYFSGRDEALEGALKEGFTLFYVESILDIAKLIGKDLSVL